MSNIATLHQPTVLCATSTATTDAFHPPVQLVNVITYPVSVALRFKLSVFFRCFIRATFIENALCNTRIIGIRYMAIGSIHSANNQTGYMLSAQPVRLSSGPQVELTYVKYTCNNDIGKLLLLHTSGEPYYRNRLTNRIH